MRRTRPRQGASFADSEPDAEKIVGASDKINIPTDLLRTFVAIYQLGSFTKAAQLFELTQPAVSAHMKKLESLIGADLIEKNVAGVHLTPYGDEVLKYARRILSINDQIVNSSVQHRTLPVIRLGIPNLYAAAALKRISTECRAEAGNYRLQICCDHSPGLLRSIRSGYLDLSCVMTDEVEIERALRSWSEELVWVRAPDFVLDPDGVIPIISSPNMLLPDRLAMEALDAANQRYEIVFTAFDTLVRRAGAAAGLGCYPLPRPMAPDDLVIEESGILPPLPRVTIGIVAREDLDTGDLTSFIASVQRVLASGA
jgi:DNA-binding transcriptional LysR family regulator